ncbi:unnamed protein product [Orchesella dallaii]|uniref:BED-type domain-containing protein n=1 Tax=Orchesella dallaii TaxID=48710 RepID=A0ABP1PWJ8_9HEXA
MSLRDQLINNEIQHLGQMLQTLSYELTLLQDFIKEKFGPDYDAFRRNLTDEHQYPATSSSSNAPAPRAKASTSSKTVKVTARKSTAPRPGGYKRERSDGNWETENRGEVKEKRRKDSEEREEEDQRSTEERPMAYDEESSSAIEDGVEEDEDDDEIEMEFPVDQKNIHLLIEQEVEETGERVDFNQQNRGKPRKAIWNKFIVTKLPNEKLHVRCPICKDAVSSKSSRMEKHYEKCRPLEVPGSQSDPVPGTSSNKLVLAEEKQETLKAMRELKKEKRLTIASELGGPVPLGPGRRLDPVWAYFNVADDPTTGNKMATCKRCQTRVSSRVHRVRRHFIICHELDKEVEREGEEEQVA